MPRRDRADVNRAISSAIEKIRLIDSVPLSRAVERARRAWRARLESDDAIPRRIGASAPDEVLAFTP
jgi:hypothetical protein